MRASDVATMEPLWRAGFAEMGPHSYAKSVSSCAPLLWGAAAGALLWAAGFPVAGACATASAALFFTPLGSAALNGALWLAIRAQKLGFPPAGSTAAQFFVAEAGGELLGCVCVKEAHTGTSRLLTSPRRGSSAP